MVRDICLSVRAQVVRWSPEAGDALLYAGAALFAVITARTSGLALYRQWGLLAIGPYVVAAVVSALLGRHRAHVAALAAVAPAPGEERSAEVDPAAPAPSPAPPRHWSPARIWIFVFVLAGATILPLSLEVAWRADGNPTSHVQPEGLVVQQAAHRVADGQHLYQPVHRKDGHYVSAVPDQPVYESFYPYLPLMTVFGLPSSTKEPVRVTDARLFFTIFTLLVVAAALALARPSSEPKVRALQFLTVLPTAALPLATGGDDMPVVAMLLLAMVLAQRRKPGWAGVALGVASAMKFTAWPLAALALFAARTPDGRRAPGRMALGMLVVTGPAVLPFLVQNPGAFFENVVLFPLGLSGVASPAASPLPGHLLVSAFPALHRALPVVGAVVGGLVLMVHLVRRPPRTPAQVTLLAGWVMTVAILLAPATRVGYLLYPVNCFVWSALLRRCDPPELPADDERAAAALKGEGAGPEEGPDGAGRGGGRGSADERVAEPTAV